MCFAKALYKFKSVPTHLNNKASLEKFTKWNKVRTNKNLFRLFAKSANDGITDMIWVTKVIQATQKKREKEAKVADVGRYAFELDGTYYFKTPIKNGTCSIELIFGDVIGIHFTDTTLTKSQSKKFHYSKLKHSVILINVNDLEKKNNEYIFSKKNTSDSSIDDIQMYFGIGNGSDASEEESDEESAEDESEEESQEEESDEESAEDESEEESQEEESDEDSNGSYHSSDDDEPIRYPFKECKQGYVYSDQDGDRIYYLSDGNVDVYSRYNIPVDNEYMTPSEFGKLNKDATLTEIGKYSANDVYHKPVKNDNIRYLFEDDNGDTNWHNGVIKSVVRGVYKVKYENDKTTHKQDAEAFSKDKFNEHWMNSNNDDANSKQAEGGPQEPASTRKKSTKNSNKKNKNTPAGTASTRKKSTKNSNKKSNKTSPKIATPEQIDITANSDSSDSDYTPSDHLLSSSDSSSDSD